ncbi:hypothetical protein [Dyadobacter crusticola]|uniref:hypothetical protein n=1 Tax=Dyadobacter crusticola TaxID=292407 RepID=UPI0004E16C11|nr:hypothetical protein [Dyadobacter crusticola]
MEQTVLKSGTYIQISVKAEQKLAARKLVEHSLAHHRVANIWDKAQVLPASTRMLRFTGTLGEIVFADSFHLPRPTRSFGADDGQDWGQDFLITSELQDFSVDVKSMKRRTGSLAGEYVLNIPASQLNKPKSKTTHYFCISFHQSETDGTIASLLGFIDKSALQNGEVGKFYAAGTKRVRADGTSFTFNENTYEILFKEISPVTPTAYIRSLTGFRVCALK